jgi:hypothetical protein
VDISGTLLADAASVYEKDATVERDEARTLT